ncbi:MAG: SEC-C metal-binding domain-containing protein [Pseudomonadota bacterium]
MSCARPATSPTSPAFAITRKRRKSFPSETHVKRGRRLVHGDVELTEKLGRNDLCPCGSARKFQSLLHALGRP